MAWNISVKIPECSEKGTSAASQIALNTQLLPPYPKLKTRKIKVQKKYGLFSIYSFYLRKL